MSTYLTYPLIVLGTIGLFIWIINLIILLIVSFTYIFSRKGRNRKSSIRIHWIIGLASIYLISIGLTLYKTIGFPSSEYTWCGVMLGYGNIIDPNMPVSNDQYEQLIVLGAYSKELLHGCSNLFQEISNRWDYLTGAIIQFILGVSTLLLIKKRRFLIAALIGIIFTASDVKQVIDFFNHINQVVASIGIYYNDPGLQAKAIQLLLEISFLHFLTLFSAILVSNYIEDRLEATAKLFAQES